MSIAITTNNLMPLSAVYPYANIDIKSNVTKWKDGYITHTHPIFTSNIDCSLNNDSIFYLTSSMSLFDIVKEIPLDVISLGDYVTINIDSRFVSNVNNELYLTSLSSDNSYFKVIANGDNSYSFLQGTGLYVTVDNQEPFNLNLEVKRPTNELHHQKFNIVSQNNEIYITTTITNESGVGDSIQQRFWGYTKFGPEAGRIRANGTIINDNYLFTVSNFSVNYQAMGLTRDHTWVEYYNILENTENNKNVEINETESLTGIKVNHLVDLPYNSTINISKGSMDVNLANMKTIQTSNYEYRKK